MNIKTAKRLETVEEYYFSKKLREVRALASSGKPIINMAIGSPDIEPPADVTASLMEALSDPSAHKYQSYQGIPELRSAIQEFYASHYKVNLDREKEILPLMGSKEGIMHISLAFLNAGDQVLIPNPGYPTYSSVSKLVGAEPLYYNLSSNTNWLPNYDELEGLDLSKVKMMWINYPHMPTGARISSSELKKLIDFAKRNHILLVNDNPYSFILNEDPLSLFSIAGGKEVGLELNSLSKTFNMAGWRVGMLTGRSEFIEAVLNIKSNMDSGMFYGIQKGAVSALKCSTDWFEKLNSIYTRRRNLIWQLADQLGCTYDKSTVGMFVWAKLPKGLKGTVVIDKILYEKDIFIAPGEIFGSNGEGYIRFSLCVDEQTIKKAIKRMENFSFELLTNTTSI